MVTGRRLYAFICAFRDMRPQEGAVESYNAALAYWDAHPGLQSMGADTKTPGTWGWWAVHLEDSPPHCATCRWAEREGGGGVPRLPLKCGRILTLDYCEIPQMLAVVITNDDAEFNVSPDFGCVMWEAKP